MDYELFIEAANRNFAKALFFKNKGAMKWANSYAFLGCQCLAEAAKLARV